MRSRQWPVSSVAIALSAASSVHFECSGHDGQVLIAEALVDDRLPFGGQAGERGEAICVGSFEREMHVLERQRQWKLRREVAFENALKFGGLPRRHERATTE